VVDERLPLWVPTCLLAPTLWLELLWWLFSSGVD